MFFDCTGLLAGLAASVITKWKANERFSYGYVRAEVLAGFVNSLFLLFISFFIMSEAIERAVEPPEVIIIRHGALAPLNRSNYVLNMTSALVFRPKGDCDCRDTGWPEYVLIDHRDSISIHEWTLYLLLFIRPLPPVDYL